MEERKREIGRNSKRGRNGGELRKEKKGRESERAREKKKV